MRLQILENGFSSRQKIPIRLIKVIAGYLPGPIAVMSYRRAFFGKTFSQALQYAMRKMSAWEISDVELFAAFVSQRNQCGYCLNDHTGVASLAGDRTLVLATLNDWQTAPLDEKHRAMLNFLEKLTLDPTTVNKLDIQILRNHGLTDQAIEEAIRVCFVFGVINRLADAFAFEIPSEAATRRVSRILYTGGYGIASLPD